MTVVVDKHPLAISSPGLAMSSNTLVAGQGRIVLARIYPRNSDPVAVRIFTASGRLVRRVSSLTAISDGQFLATWDGRNDDNDYVARGVYLVHVQGGGLNSVTKVIVK